METKEEFTNIVKYHAEYLRETGGFPTATPCEFLYMAMNELYDNLGEVVYRNTKNLENVEEFMNMGYETYCELIDFSNLHKPTFIDDDNIEEDD